MQNNFFCPIIREKLLPGQPPGGMDRKAGKQYAHQHGRMHREYLRPIVDIIAPPHPFHLMGTLQFLGHALNSFHLLHDGV